MDIRCIKCGEPLKPEWDECPECETPVKKELTCPVCGGEIRETWKKCPICKTRLQSDIETGSEVKTNFSGTRQNTPFSTLDSPNVYPDPTETGSRQSAGYYSGNSSYNSPPFSGANLSDVPEIPAGEVLLGQYRIERVIGKGSTGVVYKAFDITIEEFLAIKTVAAFNKNKQVTEALVQEYKAQREIKHTENILRIDRPQPCTFSGLEWVILPMELADKSFRNWLIETSVNMEERLKEGLDLFKQACIGVDALHQSGMIHLDLKPENILLFKEVQDKEEKWKVKVSDFGLTRGSGKMAQILGHTEEGKGTAAYMAPEQILAAHWKDVGKEADIYALGMILYELIDGDLPYSGEAHKIQEKKLNKEIKVRRPKGNEHIADIAMQCIARESHLRPENLIELLYSNEKFGETSSEIKLSVNKTDEFPEDSNPLQFAIYWYKKMIIELDKKYITEINQINLELTKLEE